MDFNSRYKNADNNLNTIKTNTGTFDGFDDMDIMEAESRQKHRQVSRASQARGSASRGRKSRKQMLVYAIIIAIEIIALAVIWTLYFTGRPGKDSKKSEQTESSSSNSGGSIDVDNDKFSVKCTKIQITTGADGSPVATIRFTFTNKTDTPLSMAQVFAPSFMQAGVQLSDIVSLTEEAQELYNKDTQIANGESIECWYTAALQDTTSEITITMHDNYETFSDIGTTVVPIS